jgi:fluoroquinolone resistance protein
MSKNYIEEKTFSKEDFSTQTLPNGDYENCSFLECNLSNSDLSGITFSECLFTGCNLSLANLSGTAFRNVEFKDCKLLGLHFHNCNPFLLSLDFQNCNLNLTSFYRLKLKKTRFKNCSLQEADLSEADFSSSLFDNCELARAIFVGTILEKADFRTSYNYSIHPESNRIKEARFSLAGIRGLLDSYDIEVE